MPSEWAEKYTLALAHREGFSQGQKAMIANALDASRAQGRREGLEEERLQERKRQDMILWREVFVAAFKEDVPIGDCARSAGRAVQLFRMFYEKAENA